MQDNSNLSACLESGTFTCKNESGFLYLKSWTQLGRRNLDCVRLLEEGVVVFPCHRTTEDGTAGGHLDIPE